MDGAVLYGAVLHAPHHSRNHVSELHRARTPRRVAVYDCTPVLVGTLPVKSEIELAIRMHQPYAQSMERK